MLRLQQILFYRELDFPLKEIAEVLDDPEFDIVEALQNHKSALVARRKRIATLLKTIDNTIDHIQNQKKMSKPEELYQGLPKEMGTTHRQTAIDEYGQEAVTQSEQALLALGKEGIAQLKAKTGTGSTRSYLS